MEVHFNDFKIIPVYESACHADIADSVYFSKKYAGYISNSKLGDINPAQGGSPTKYFDATSAHLDTGALALGTVVHCMTLQPEDFSLGERCDKPTAKLGKVIDKIIEYRKQGLSIYDSITRACLEVSYYVTTIDKHIKDIIAKGLKYYLTAKDYDSNILTLNNKDYDTAVLCIDNLKNDSEIMSKLHPKGDFLEDLPSFMEDTLFLDFAVLYKGRGTLLKFKGKLDNWTIDEDDKTVTLNDLKTTGKPVAWFMNPEYGSFVHYHYGRQLALYGIMLKALCTKLYGFNDSWKLNYNILAVQTVDNCNTRCCRISNKQLADGNRELNELLCRIAYYQMFGHEKEVNFV